MNYHPYIAAIIISAAALYFLPNIQQNLGGSVGGQASVATSSVIKVGPQEDKTLFAANRTCTSRTIGTAGEGVYLSVHSVVNPSTVIGFPVAASTTLVLDAANWGCGAVTAAALGSTTITVMEAR
jgi:hypothetical protein